MKTFSLFKHSRQMFLTDVNNEVTEQQQTDYLYTGQKQNNKTILAFIGEVCFHIKLLNKEKN